MVRVGLVGFGMAARVFHGPLVSSVEGLELAAVMERSANKGAERYPGVTTYRSLDAMLADSSLQLFVVATPNAAHFEMTRQILQAGKNVVVDKPVALRSSEIAELMALAEEKNALLVPFHNRRWDSDFRTIQKLLQKNSLGRLVHFESQFNRWRPEAPTDRLWKEDPTNGGMAMDLGPHLIDQALVLFGKPNAVSADILNERKWARSGDSFSIRLHYARLVVVLGGNSLSLPPGPRFHLRGAEGNYWKLTLDPQEAALNRITRIDDPAWGQEPEADWGVLYRGVEGKVVEEKVRPIPGDYRLYYAGVRDAVLGKAPAPVATLDAWRGMRILEWARESAEQRREIVCDWSGEPLSKEGSKA